MVWARAHTGKRERVARRLHQAAEHQFVRVSDPDGGIAMITKCVAGIGMDEDIE